MCKYRHKISSCSLAVLAQYKHQTAQENNLRTKERLVSHARILQHLLSQLHFAGSLLGCQLLFARRKAPTC